MMANHAGTIHECQHDMSDGYDCQMTHSCLALLQAPVMAVEAQFVGALGTLTIGHQRLRPEALYRPPKQ
ncbi:hypothetical protein GCM10025772_13310 [Ferrimonas gelatinilytica]|uniref:Uncharacterized protein n=2 Tax=Ferrimonas gelatinilytica TaxID=1255257 RepID=A0ABP9S1W8_9GAMM